MATTTAHDRPEPDRDVSLALSLVVEMVILIVTENNGDAVHQEGGMVHNGSGGGNGK